jgi:hypothetical protein
VDGVRYQAMKRAILKIMPPRSPGLTVAEIQSAVLAHLTSGTVSRTHEVRLVGQDRSVGP